MGAGASTPRSRRSTEPPRLRQGIGQGGCIADSDASFYSSNHPHQFSTPTSLFRYVSLFNQNSTQNLTICVQQTLGLQIEIFSHIGISYISRATRSFTLETRISRIVGTSDKGNTSSVLAISRRNHVET